MPRIPSNLFLAFALLSASTFARLSGQADGGAVARGKGIFAANCGFCHGSQAMGTEQAPNLVRSPLLARDENGSVLIPVIRAGRTNSGMPSFASLPQQQLSDIVAFLHARAGEVRERRVPETAMLVGDAQKGELYFKGTGKCSSCHSVTGDLAHVGTEHKPLALTMAFLTPPPAPQQVKVTLPSGETVSGVLAYQDEFQISLTDGAGLYHTWSLKSLGSVEITDPLASHKEMLTRYTDDDIHNLLAYLVTLK